MGVSGRTSKVSTVVAALCIVIYVVAIAFGAIQIIVSIGERKHLAATEFDDLLDRASSSAVILGFMSEAYQETIKDFLGTSQTILGIIITGSNGEYAFERFPGSGINWSGTSPRLKIGPGFSDDHRFLRIEGQRNVTLQAVYSYLNYPLLLTVLRNTLLAVLAALAIAFITLLVELTGKKRAVSYNKAEPVGSSRSGRGSGTAGSYVDLTESIRQGADSNTWPASIMDPDIKETRTIVERVSKTTPTPVETEEPNLPVSEISSSDLLVDESESDDSTPQIDEVFFSNEPEPFEDTRLPEEDKDEGSSGELSGELPNANGPQGLYTARGNIGWESYILDRLASELHRCASAEQDLVFLVMEFNCSEKISDTIFRQFADEAVSFFTMRDLIFEKGDKGISVIIPHADLEHGMAKSEGFRSQIMTRLPESFEGRSGLHIGLSSRSGRLIEADRLMKEASAALEKTLEEPVSPIVAFKSDPEKYRAFIKEQH